MVPLGHSPAALNVVPGIQTPTVPSAPMTPVAWHEEFGFSQSEAAVTAPVAGFTCAGSQTATQALLTITLPSAPITGLPSGPITGSAPKQTPSTVSPK